ncbi:MAG TPA: choice-of-anchor tandem repeat GloVer-containing protein, partial [Verrucomicrobiae bacterium]
MKANYGSLIACLWLCLGLVSEGSSPAQTISSFIYTFTNGPAHPTGRLVVGADGCLYGTTAGIGFYGGTAINPEPGAYGTIFKILPNGKVSHIYAFGGTNGATPQSGLTKGADGLLYGLLQSNGTNQNGAIYKVTTNGQVTLVAQLNPQIGILPQNELCLGPDGALYGTSATGGTNLTWRSPRYGYGTIFRLDPNGTLANLHTFNYLDGATPATALTVGPDLCLYGTCRFGGTNNQGTLFKISTNGDFNLLRVLTPDIGINPITPLTWGPDGNAYGGLMQGPGSYTAINCIYRLSTNGEIRILHSFTDVFTYPLSGRYLNDLVWGKDRRLYGTLAWGGPSGFGYSFSCTTNGAIKTLGKFEATVGLQPQGALTLAPDGNFYGALASLGNGSLYKLTPAGSLSRVAAFTPFQGTLPVNGLTAGKNGEVYGMTSDGGSQGLGTIFKLLPNGTLTTLASFTTNLGMPTSGPLILAGDGNFYGITRPGIPAQGTRPIAPDFLPEYPPLTNGFPIPLGVTRHVAVGDDSLASPHSVNASGVVSGPVGAIFKMTPKGQLTRVFLFNSVTNGLPAPGLTAGRDGSLYGTAIRRNGTNLDSSLIYRLDQWGKYHVVANIPPTHGYQASANLTFDAQGNIYGTCSYHAAIPHLYFGYQGNGLIFKCTKAGEVSTLFDFNNTNACQPADGLVKGADGAFYGHTTQINTEVALTNAVIFRITTNGNYSALYTFDGTTTPVYLLPLSAGTNGLLYGMAQIVAGDRTGYGYALNQNGEM